MGGYEVIIPKFGPAFGDCRTFADAEAAKAFALALSGEWYIVGPSGALLAFKERGKEPVCSAFRPACP